ncbi:MAG: acyl-CoA dehydrogenase [Solirubrobacterales bacterium]
MRFALSNEQHDLRESVRGVLARAASPDVVRGWLESGSQRGASELCVTHGWTGIGVPVELGGEGGGLVELSICVEEAARAALPGALLCHAGLATHLLAAAFDPARSALAERLLAGELLATVLIDASEIPTRPPVRIETGADGGWRVTGNISYVLGAAGTDFALLPAVSEDRVLLLAIALDEPAVSVDDLPSADPSRGLAKVRMEQAPATQIGTLPGEAMDGLAGRAAALIAADSLGAASRMLEMTVGYVRDREQFGVPVGSFQAVKHEAAEMMVDVESSRSIAYFAAWSLASGEPDAPTHAAAAKFVSCEAAARVADRALALHGAIGFTWEHDLHFLYKRAKANVALFSESVGYREQVASGVL